MSIMNQIQQAVNGLGPMGAGRQQQTVQMGGQKGPNEAQILQLMLQQEAAQRSGLAAAEEKAAKKEQEDRRFATLQVMLGQALAEQQAQAAHQRNIELFNRQVQSQNEYRAAIEKAAQEKTQAIIQGNEELVAQAQRKIDEAAANEKRVMGELITMSGALQDSSQFVAGNLKVAGEQIGSLYRKTIARRNQVQTRNAKLATILLSGSWQEAGVRDRSILYTARDGEGGKTLRKTEGGPVGADEPAMFAEIAMSNIFQTQKGGMPVGLKGQLQALMIAAMGGHPEDFAYARTRIADMATPEQMLELQDLINQAGSIVHETDQASVGPDGKEIKAGTGPVGNRGRSYQALSTMWGAGIGRTMQELPNPEEAMDLYLVQVQVAMSDPNLGPEDRQKRARQITNDFTSSLAKEMSWDEEKLAEARGAMLAAVSHMLPLEEKIQTMQRYMVEEQIDADSQAARDLYEKTPKALKTFLEDMIGQSMTGDLNVEAKGDQQATPGPQPSRGANDSGPAVGAADL